nr:glycosyltransferase [Halochromatium roseum]
MPTHNANVGFLREAIDSCIAQTHPHWELIIVDDGSTNESPLVIAEQSARDARIRSLRHASKRRLPAALNSGIEQAQGDFLTWLSDDDRFRPLALERMLKFLSEHPQIDIVYADYSLLQSDGTLGERMRVGPAEELGIHKPVGICYLAKYEAFARTGFSEDFFLAEDLDFWIRACMTYKATPLHEDLAQYRQHRGTLTQSHPRTEILSVHRRILDRHLDRMHWLSPANQVRAYLRLGKQFLAQGAAAPAAAAFGRAVSFGPHACAAAFSDLVTRKIGQYTQLQRS